MIKPMIRTIACLVALSPLQVAWAAESECAVSLTPSILPTSEAKRSLTPTDLIELRDIGSDSTGDPLSISPDGKRVAFQIRRANAKLNDYCLGIAIVPLALHAQMHLVDVGGKLVLGRAGEAGGIGDQSVGYPAIVQPKWSPDGHWLAYVRKEDGVPQTWIAKADGTEAKSISRSAIGVEDVWWSLTGRLLYTELQGLEKARDQIRSEAETGYRYDLRWQPAADDRPLAADSSDPVLLSVDPLTRDMRPATSEEREAAGLSRPADVDTHAKLFARGRNREIAWTAAEDPTNMLSDDVLRAALGRRIISCREAACHGHILGLWWSRDRSVTFLRRTGWGSARSGLFRWNLESGQVSTMFESEALLSGCQAAPQHLVCMSEDAIHPAHVISIDLVSGHIVPIYDPNPELSNIKLGSVQRLYWKNNIGLEAFGDLVLPPDHRAGERHPLIVVQYISRGFLRGGTGDAYPIQVFANAGYAVLSVQRPLLSAYLFPEHSNSDIIRHEIEDAIDAKSVLSSLEIGVAKAIATGSVDPNRIGLTGLSDGAAKARYAALHSSLFKTIAISSCCDDPTSFSLLGPAIAEEVVEAGYSPIGKADTAFWTQFSILDHLSDFRTPMLIQTADREYLRSVATVEALRQANRAVDLYVFPNEYHVFWQPAHRLAQYRRDVAWFDFWLRDRLPQVADYRTLEEVRRWQAMRTQIQR